MENLEEFLCKKDVWLNIKSDAVEVEEISRNIGFEKLYPNSILVFKKYCVYKKRINSYGEYVIMNSDIENSIKATQYRSSKNFYFLFSYNNDNDYLYFYSVFMKSKFIRKVKIMRLFNS